MGGFTLALDCSVVFVSHASERSHARIRFVCNSQGPLLCKGSTYAVRLYNNLNIIPGVCRSEGITTASAMRYVEGGPNQECTQLDMAFDPTYSVRKVPTGLVFSYQLGGVNTLELNLICLPGAGAGLPGDAVGTQPLSVNWLNGLTCPEVHDQVAEGVVNASAATTATPAAAAV